MYFMLSSNHRAQSESTNSARLYLHPAASDFKSEVVRGHLTDLKMWRTARCPMNRLGPNFSKKE